MGSLLNQGCQRAYMHIDRYLKNSVSKSIAHMIKYANFQLYRVHPNGVI